jgi:poly(3-hydroxybutyrate) depolymerase
MLDSRHLFSTIGCALALALGVACTDGTTGFEDGDGGGAPGGAAGSGVSGGMAGNAGSTSSSGGTGMTTGGTTSGGQGGTSAGTGASGMSGTDSGGAGGSGATDGGSAGMGTAGMGTAGMGTAGMGGMAPTSGCGAATWPPGDGMALQTIDVGGTPREYIVQLPSAYDPNHPYRLIFAWHGRTGTAAQIARNFYNLETTLGATTIFVSGQGLGTAEDPADTGWPNTNGQDVTFVRTLLASLSSSYCIDENRIMSVGMSYGGIMSYHLGCQMSDVFRAIAPIAGASFGGRGQTCGTNPVAVLAVHGTADDQVTFANGESAKNSYVTRNGCMMTAQPVEPQPYCTQYDGCTSGYPVVWCVHDGGHTIPQWSGPAIATFFQQF